jgi:hypothetical protein
VDESADDVTTSTTVATTSSAGLATSVSISTSVAEADRSSTTTGSGYDCVVSPVPASAGLDPFYRQGCRLGSFWVVAHDVVDPQAVEAAGAFVAALFDHDEELADTLMQSGVRLGVIGAGQRTTEMPEYRDLNQAFPNIDWDERARGLGATEARPLVSAGEENILCFASDRYAGEDILLHEFAHVLDEFVYSVIDRGFTVKLAEAYDQAMVRGTWDETYSAENQFEYWAEGVQSYFNRNLGNDVADGIHGPIDTRSELAEADRPLFDLIDERLSDLPLPEACLLD